MQHPSALRQHRRFSRTIGLALLLSGATCGPAWAAAASPLQLHVPGAAAAAASQAEVSPSSTEAQGVAASVRAATVPSWWTGYREPALESLINAAPRTSAASRAGLQTDLVRLYLSLRVYNARLANAVTLWRATQQEREFFSAQAPTRTAAEVLHANAQRMATAQQLTTALTEQRDAALRRLLQLAGQREDVRVALQTALDQTDFPQFHVPVPERLPASVLLSREDIALMGRHSSGRGPVGMLLSGWIGPAAHPAPLQVPSLGEAKEGAPDEVVRQAGQEVAWSLRVLLETQRRAAAETRRLEARRLDLMALERRVQAGDADPPQLMLGYQQLLAEADALGQARGQLALAWAELHALAPGSMQALVDPR